MNKTEKNFQRFAAGMGCNYSIGTDTFTVGRKKETILFAL